MNVKEQLNNIYSNVFFRALLKQKGMKQTLNN